MPQEPLPAHDVQRLRAYDRLLDFTTQEIKKRPAALLLNIQDIQMEQLKKNSEREVWTLFDNALRHLKNGGPKGKPGMFATAATKVSLRSSYIAQTLMIPAPKFEQQVFSVDYKTPEEEALFFCKRLCEFAHSDLEISEEKIVARLNDHKGDGILFSDDMKKQMIVSFHLLTDAYSETIDKIYKTAPKLLGTPPKPSKPTQGKPPQGGSFNI